MTLPYPVVRTLPGFQLSVCSTKGTPPLYTTLTKNSTVLINTTDNDIAIRLYEEGNYTCVATGKDGADVGEFSVIFNGKVSCQRALKSFLFPCELELDCVGQTICNAYQQVNLCLPCLPQE